MANRAERVLGYELRRLSQSVREEVIEKWAQETAQDEWWDFVYEDAKRIGALMGIRVDDIQFSGFCSQGDGASFTGRYACVPEGAKAVKAEASEDKELHRIAEELTRLQTTLKLQHGFTFECRIDRSIGNYSHSRMMSIGDWGTEELAAAFDGRHRHDYCDREIIGPFQELLRDFANWIYRQLEAEYEHLTSVESITDQIEGMGLRFSSTGDTMPT